MKQGDVVRRPGGVILGVVRGTVRDGRAAPGSVWVRWDTGLVMAEDPAKLEIVVPRPV